MDSEERIVYEGSVTDQSGNFYFEKVGELSGPLLTATTRSEDEITSEYSLPTSTTWPTATATPTPAWVNEISEPILAAIKDLPPDFADDFSQVDYDWSYSQYEEGYNDVLCSNTAGPKMIITDGSMKLGVDPDCPQGILSHPVMENGYANYVLQMEVNFKLTSGAFMFRYFDPSEWYEELNFVFNPIFWFFNLM